MLAPVRHQKILEYLEKNQNATTLELSSATNASAATIRRDLNTLAGQGLLRKTHGGAQALPADLKETRASALPQENGASFFSGLAPFMSLPEQDPDILDKSSIALRASELVETDDIIFVGAGMTCNLLCRHLRHSSSRHVTIVTSNVTAVMELASNNRFQLFLLGGDIHKGKNHVETLDDYSLSALRRLYFTKAFITVDGADLQSGYSILNKEQLLLYNYLLENSDHLYVLLNKSKYNKRSFVHFCGMEKIKHVITNRDTDDMYRSYFEENQIDAVYV